MRRIELLGLPGSGKSSLAAFLLSRTAGGAAPLFPSERLADWFLVHRAPARDRLLAKLPLASLRRKLAARARALAVERFHRLNPVFAAAFAHALAQGGEPEADQEGSRQSFARSASEWIWAGEYAGRGGVLCEEGLVQRILSATAFTAREVNPESLVAALPDHPLVVCVRTPPGLVLERLRARSQAPRVAFARLNDAAKLAALQRAQSMLDQIVVRLRAAGLDVRTVPGDARPTAYASTLDALVADAGRTA